MHAHPVLEHRGGHVLAVGGDDQLLLPAGDAEEPLAVKLAEVTNLATGRADIDLANLVEELVLDEAVPYLAAWRFTDGGMRSHAVWERTWQLQRQEDAIDALRELSEDDPRRLSAEQAAARKKVEAAEYRFAGSDAPGGVEDAHDGVGGDGLAGTRLADNGNRLAFRDAEADVLQRLHHAGAPALGQAGGELIGPARRPGRPLGLDGRGRHEREETDEYRRRGAAADPAGQWRAAAGPGRQPHAVLHA